MSPEAQTPKLTLSVHPGALAICRLDPGSEIPAWARDSSFFSITRTADELSIVCDAALVPEGVKRVSAWRAFKVEGPLDFSLTGIVSSISGVLAANQVPLFVISTYDTDYILVQEGDFLRAKEVLGRAFQVMG
ncbi:MAG: ACT domain-containing protein [Cyclobacteriaceae bacterium]|nr:ACT domain-containing protein [Cyclobacteriaceae bacterium]